MAFLCQLLVNTGCAGITTMVMHAQSHAQAHLAARELFPACSVEVIALELPPRRTRDVKSSEADGPGTGPGANRSAVRT